MTNHIMAPVDDHRNQEMRNNIKKQCEHTNSSLNACHSSKLFISPDHIKMSKATRGHCLVNLSSAF